MAKISIGGTTLTQNPSEMTVIKKDRISASKRTYSDVAFFSWGPTIIGKEIELLWRFMSITDFAALQAIYEADAAVVFNPQDGSSKTYNVEMTSFDGKYHITQNVTGNGYRKDVRAILLILSEV